MITDTATQETQRIIFQCKNKNCKHVWAYDYQISRRRSNFNRMEYVTYYRDVDRKRLTSSDEYFTGCPVCHSKFIEGNVVKGTYSDKKACDSRCMNAKGADCDCSCAGKNHGINHL